MSDSSEQIAALRKMRDAAADPAQREALDAALAALEAAVPAPAVDLRGAQTGDNTFGDVAGRDVDKRALGAVALSADARIDGVAVGVNLGTVIYGRDPSEDERRRLAWYLARLADKLYRLPLRGLEEHLDQGDGVSLAKVYVSLAVSSRSIALRVGDAAAVKAYFKDGDLGRPLRREHDPDFALPDQAVTAWGRDERDGEGRRVALSLAELARTEIAAGERLLLWRPFLASEVLEHHRLRMEGPKRSPRVVLLGDPGSGKSTFVRHLAWALARRGLDQLDAATGLLGWDTRRRVLPIILPLRSLSRRLAAGGDGAPAVFAALRDEMHACCMHRVDDLLSASLDSGAALVLLDGLDEVPIEGRPGEAAPRAATLEVVRAFAQLHGRAQVVLTCRTRAFDQGSRQLLAWPVETIAPFTLGQVRHFVLAWYGELVARGQVGPDQAQRLGASLVGSILASPRLRAMAETPLLLTLMALVLFNRGELPRDRPQLYERILDLLLGQWDQVKEGQSLAESVGLPDWGSERFRPLLDRLSYEAHLAGSSRDGRGRISRDALRIALIDFFEAAEVPEAWGAARRCLEYFEQRSGLVSPDGPDSYVFAHLTLQEHCAGRHIALNSEDPVALAMRHRADDRWREPIFLGAGLMRPAELNALLADLVDPEERGQVKAIPRWYRDLILAAEVGKDRDWAYLRTRPAVKVERLQRDLREGLVALLGDAAQPLPAAERVRAGFLLGELGDPRYPVTTEQWRREVERALAGDTGGYFCRVEAGAYIVGSADDDPDARDEERPRHHVRLAQPLLVARYPLTNDQWRAWAQAGGRNSNYDDDANRNHSNQPVVGVSWDDTVAFCAWMSEQAGLELRLPTEAEWEAAARGGDARIYPWGDAWQGDRAATAADRETRDGRWTVPVGCYPAGAAHCGALDMAGNVWEWTADSWRSYPGAKKQFTDEGRRVLRGGGYGDSGTGVRCGARNRHYPYGWVNDLGVRLVAAPRLAHPS